jgi:hypothetical protein
MNDLVTKERPILFSGPMVRALLDGRKTQTRRVVKPQPTTPYNFPSNEKGSLAWFWHHDMEYDRWTRRMNRYGLPGDRLWVQEEHVIHGREFNLFDVSCLGERRCVKVADDELQKYKQRKIQETPRYMRARFMYRSFSRITLEITGVRVERLQDISEADAMAEGAPSGPAPEFSAQECFKALWQTINGKDSWDANPWVWVVGFKVLSK